jgi:pimeloyl-ACP methyl ester carboxylesterase
VVPDVLFLPGIIAPASIRYAPLLAALGEVNAVAKDLEVYRSATPPPDYSIQMEVDGVEAAVDSAGFERVHLYGHSGGGAIALAYVAQHPARVASLAVDEPASDFTAEARADLQHFKELASVPYAERMVAFMHLQVAPTVELPPPPDGPAPPWMASRPAGIDAFLLALEAQGDVDDRYADYPGPVLYTWGSRTHPRWFEMRDRLADRFPDFTSERFEGIHHLNTSHQAEPERVAGLLRALWARA